MAHEIHPRLLRSATLLGYVGETAILLKDNAHFPWFMLVPATEVKNLCQLDDQTHASLFSTLKQLSRAILENTPASIINVGEIGNVVQQMHVHVVGRHEGDPAFPGVVWGFSEKKAYTEPEVHAYTQLLAAEINGFVCADST